MHPIVRVALSVDLTQKLFLKIGAGTILVYEAHSSDAHTNFSGSILSDLSCYLAKVHFYVATLIILFYPQYTQMSTSVQKKTPVCLYADGGMEIFICLLRLNKIVPKNVRPQMVLNLRKYRYWKN